MHSMSHGMSQSTMDPAEMERQRYLHHMQRRSMPPRCNPIGIIIMVLALGMIFIGLTMTVIAHWPGNSSIGENPLKIAGPVLLSLGGAVFILGIILICFWQGKEKKNWQKSMQQLAASRSVMNNPYLSSSRYTSNEPEEEDESQMYLSHGQSMEAKPGRGILKTPSVSTYGKGSEYGDDPNHYNQYGYGYDGSDQSGGQHELYKIDTLPDSRSGGPVGQSSIDYDQAIPDPVRKPKEKKPRVSGELLEEPKREKEGRQMKSYTESEGFDMYQGEDGKPQKKPRSRKKKGTEGDKPRRHDERHDSSHSNEAYMPDRAATQNTGYYANVPGEDSSPTVYTGAGLTSPLAGSGLGGSGLAGSGLAGMGGMGVSPAMEQQLRINIRAQPNTAVHITPGMYRTPPRTPPENAKPLAPYSKHNMSQSSVETEI